MRPAKFLPLFICPVFPLICVGEAQASARLPDLELKKLVQSAGLGDAWQIDQLATGRKGTAWAVSVLATPRILSNSYCYANLVNLGIEMRGEEYILVEKDDAHPAVAWKNCDRAFLKAGDFHDIVGTMTDPEIVSSMKVVDNLLGITSPKQSLQVHFTGDDLSVYFHEGNLKYLQMMQKHKDGSVLFSFWVPELFPNVLDVRLTTNESGQQELYASKEPGPDLIIPNTGGQN